MPPKKSDMVREFVKNGEFKKALAIVKTFRMGISKEDISTMTRAYETMTNGRFYASLGYDTEQLIVDGIATVKRIYG